MCNILKHKTARFNLELNMLVITFSPQTYIKKKDKLRLLQKINNNYKNKQ